ncbi:hypothetical protein EOL72_01745 [Candidatus Falkowbacteria bacterium]|jgi:hypothetical protein|nr:hypothetical protein [Patescibacteria group bacterium]NCU43056.1 hypothetical protein [Candidatus Falkowbacteria bacterium]
MRYYSRLAVTIYPLIILLLSEIYFFKPNAFYLVLGLALLLTVFLAWSLRAPGKPWSWLLTIFIPAIFLASSSIYASLQMNKIIVQLIFLLITVFLFVYFRNLYYYYHHSKLYEAEEFVVVKSFGGLMTIFFAAASMFGLQSLLNLTTWPMFLIFVALGLVMVFANLEDEPVEASVRGRFSLVIAYILAETALVFLLLPLQYNVSALCLAIVYYFLINITRLYLRQALTLKKIRYYLLVSAAGIMLLLLTARWFN